MLINFVDATNDANHYTKPPPCKLCERAMGVGEVVTSRCKCKHVYICKCRSSSSLFTLNFCKSPLWSLVSQWDKMRLGTAVPTKFRQFHRHGLKRHMRPTTPTVKWTVFDTQLQCSLPCEYKHYFSLLNIFRNCIDASASASKEIAQCMRRCSKETVR